MPAPTVRVLLTRRWAVLTLILALVVGTCAVLGFWQWQRGVVVVRTPASTLPVAPVEQVVGGSDPLVAAEVGRRVRVQGTWDPSVRFLLPGRPLDGRDGAWVLGMVRLPGGAGVPVVRGWAPAGAQVPPVPVPGAADVVGVVQPPEAQDQGAGRGPLPPGQSWVVSAAVLVNHVDYPVVPAYVVATAPAAQDAALRPVPPHLPGSETRRLDWRNIAYALQWLVFAVFSVVLWARALRDEASRAPSAAGTGTLDDRPHPRDDGSAELLEEHSR